MTLRQYQQEGVAWLQARTRALLADEMGLGKTIQVLSALPPEAVPHVICPASVTSVWRMECAKWRPDLADRLVVSSYAKIQRVATTHLIADEAHYLKNHKATRTKVFRELAKHTPVVWGLTGTPLMNRPQELWGVTQSLGIAQQAFYNWNNYCRMWRARRVRERWGLVLKWGDPTPEVVECLRRVTLRRKRQDVLPELPSVTYQTIDCGPLKPVYRKLCDQVDLDEVQTADDMSTVAGLAQARAALAEAKIPRLLDLIDDYEANETILTVFSAHRRPIECLVGRELWGAILGETRQRDRAELVESFQAGNLRGLALTIQAGGTGLTLTRSHHAIFADLAWTPADNSQAEGRLVRFGQDAGVIIQHLVANHPLDKAVYETLIRKQRIIDATIERL